MCTSQYWIKNPYTHRLVLSPCGKCSACLQEKADVRARRIRNSLAEGETLLFANLDYDNKYVPYITRFEMKQLCCHDNPYIYVRRDFFNRYEKVYRTYLRPKLRGTGFVVENYKNEDGSNQFDTVLVDYQNIHDLKERVLYLDFPNRTPQDFKSFDFDDLRSFNGYNVRNKVGVLWYPDFQKFMKRLRFYLNKANFNDTLKWFVCAEYGARFYRPHWHVLFAGKRGFEPILTDCITKAWTYCDWTSPGKKYATRKEERILSGTDGVEKYVSSYVNCISRLPRFFRNSPFSPVWHYSHGLGIGKEFTTFPKIQEMYDRRDFRYNVEIFRNKVPSTLSVPIPTYVLSRYFPKFKGFNRLVGSSLERFIRRCLDDQSKDGISIYGLANRVHQLNYTWDNAYNVVTRVRNKFKMLHDSFGLSKQKFIEMYSQVWTIRASNLLRMFHEEDVYRQEEQYDNVLFARKVACGFTSGMKFCFSSVNDFPHVIGRTLYFTDRFHERFKHGYINDECYSLNIN